MLIYNKQLSVSPLTTHIQFQKFPKILKKDIIIKVKIDKFYKNI